MVLVERFSETMIFRHLSNHLFRSPQFWKYISYDDHPFFENVQNLIYISKLQKKIERNFLVSEIIGSELFVSNCLY